MTIFSCHTLYLFNYITTTMFIKNKMVFSHTAPRRKLSFLHSASPRLPVSYNSLFSCFSLGRIPALAYIPVAMSLVLHVADYVSVLVRTISTLVITVSVHSVAQYDKTENTEHWTSENWFCRRKLYWRITWMHDDLEYKREIGVS